MSRLLFVVNDPSFFLSHRLPVARAAQEAGLEVAVAAPEEGLEHIERAGFTTHPIELTRRSLDPWQEAKTRRSLERLYNQERPDLVHHVTIKPVVHGGHAARKAGVPAVVNAVTGLGWVFLGKGPKAAIARAVAARGYRHAFQHDNHRTIFQNGDDRSLFIKKRLTSQENSLVVLGSGIDPEEWPLLERPDQHPPLVVFPGRLLWDKGVGQFVQAAKKLQQDGVEARFALVGPSDPGNRSAVPEHTLKEWQDEATIELWGHRSDMHDVYHQAAIVCLPSRREGVPRALLEAAASGRPIVTTDAPGCREVVEQDRNGFRVPIDDAAALATRLKTLIEDPQLRQRMGLEGRKKVHEGFTESQVVEATLGVYRTVLEKAGRSFP